MIVDVLGWALTIIVGGAVAFVFLRLILRRPW